jgi:hypothetical protein
MTAIFTWLLHQAIPFLVDLGVKYGLPAAAEWVLQKWPFIPKSIVDSVMKIISDAVDAIEGNHPSSPEGKAIRSQAKLDARTAISNPSDTKGLD